MSGNQGDGDYVGTEDAVLIDLQASGFPVDPKPYCVLAERMGSVAGTEGELLETILGMRMSGRIERIGATLDADRCADLTDDELALVDLLAGDLPMSEDPFAEVAAELVRRGVDVDEAWVVERTSAWLESGLIVSFGVVVE